MYKRLEENKKFERFFRKYEKKIVSLIERYCGGKFGESELVAWIFLDNPSRKLISISDPLLLKYRKNYHFMLYVLIHELVHRFFTSNMYYRKSRSRWLQTGPKNQEVVAHLMARQIATDILDKDMVDDIFAKFHLITSPETRYIIENIEKKWNMKKHNLKYYLKK